MILEKDSFSFTLNCIARSVEGKEGRKKIKFMRTVFFVWQIIIVTERCLAAVLVCHVGVGSVNTHMVVMGNNSHLRTLLLVLP